MTSQELPEAVSLLAGRFEAIDCDCDNCGNWSVVVMFDRCSILPSSGRLCSLEDVREYSAKTINKLSTFLENTYHSADHAALYVKDGDNEYSNP